MKTWHYCILIALLCSCATAKKYDPARKWSADVLREDYSLFRKILEDSHPGLYWYTPRDSMNLYFDRGYAMLKDSMSELRFRSVLSYVLAQIHCGHTYARPSKNFVAAAGENFNYPVNLKLWPDTALVTLNTDRRDSQLTRGAMITAIEGVPMKAITDTLFQYLSADGYNRTHLYQTLSNRGGFGSAYIPVFGYKPRYKVDWIDTLGQARSGMINLFLPHRDSARVPRPGALKPSRRERKRLRRQAFRSFRIDTSEGIAYMDLSTFTKGFGLRSFFRQSFRDLREENVTDLVIDLRSNGGGSVSNSNLLTKYLAAGSFKIADSLFAVTRSSPYRRYQEHGFWNNLFLNLMTHKEGDRYHFRHFEGRFFKPKKKNHYSGNVYVVTGGNTFSAATLFAEALKGQQNVTIVGEETGGGAYGNNAWIIPDVTLPQTGVRFRLPLFRLVIDSTQEKGRGLTPEVFAGPTAPAIRAGQDFKLETVRDLIHTRRKSGR